MRLRLPYKQLIWHSNHICKIKAIVRASHSIAFHQPAKLPSTQSRQLATSSEPSASEDGADSYEHANSESKPSVKQTVEQWYCQLDPYLPLELRSKTWLENLAAFEGIRSVESLPPILKEAYDDFPQSILVHLGFTSQRWDALLYLSKALISLNPPVVVDATKIVRHNVIWNSVETPLSTPNERGIELNCEIFQTIQPHERFDHWTGPGAAGDLHTLQTAHSAIGQIWQCLGHLILEASNLDIQARYDIMAFVHQIIAQIHSEGVVSPFIYQFDSPSILSPMRKPPLLHMMSSRIMAALSDAMWRVTEPKLMGDAALIAATYAYKGREMPGSEFTPRVRPIDLETWLEFVLWSCVHGNYFMEAGRIIQHLHSQSEPWRWKTVGWEALEKKLNEQSANDKGKTRLKAWFDRIAGASEGYSEEPPAVNLGEKRISKEVVGAIAQGLVSAQQVNPGCRERLAATRFSVDSCRALVGDISSPVEILFWDAVSHKVLDDTKSMKSGSITSTLQEIEQSQQPRETFASTFGQGQTSLALEVAESRTNPLHPILLRTLEMCCLNRDISSGRIYLSQLQEWVDNNLEDLIDSRPYIPGHLSPPYASLTAYLPFHLIADLFHLTNEARMFSFGNTLLSLLDLERETRAIHGPPISHSPAIKDALLRYANSASDQNLELAIISRSDWSSGIITDAAISEMLFNQIEAGRWDSVDELLFHIQAMRRLALTAVDIARIASLFLRLPHNPRLKTLVRDLLAREYLPAPNASQPRDYTASRTLNQIARIFASIQDDKVRFVQSTFIFEGQASIPIAISAEAFNILLTSVYSAHGTPAAREFFNKWCITDPNLAMRDDIFSRAGDTTIKVVHPDLQTIRILIYYSIGILWRNVDLPPGASSRDAYKAMLNALDSLPETSKLKSNITWAMQMSDQLGLNAGGSYETLLAPEEKFDQGPGARNIELEPRSRSEDEIQPRLSFVGKGKRVDDSMLNEEKDGHHLATGGKGEKEGHKILI